MVGFFVDLERSCGQLYHYHWVTRIMAKKAFKINSLVIDWIGENILSRFVLFSLGKFHIEVWHLEDVWTTCDILVCRIESPSEWRLRTNIPSHFI